jgi:hypothetical protein
MTVASFFRKYSVSCILNYVRLIITREISCISIQLLLQLCTEVSQVTVDCFSLAPLKNSTPLILACRLVLRTILACAANDFTVSHETKNSLPGNKMYVARLKKFSLQKTHENNHKCVFSKEIKN